MPDAVLVTADEAVNTDDLGQLFERADDRGYVLVSELEDVLADDGWLDEGMTRARERGLEVVDDLGADEGMEAEDVATTETPMTSSADAVRAYLDAAARTELLDKEREADLAKRYQAGLAAAALLESGARLSPAKRAKLESIRRGGEDAKEHMVQANLRLVVAQAKRWIGRGVDLIELIQEGNLGLIRAVEKFDHTKGYKFSTYAVWWIRQALQRGVSGKARTIRVPSHVWELAAKLRRAEIDLRQQLGRDPTEEEVSSATDISVERAREISEALQQAASLDQPVGEEGDATLGDLIPDEEIADPQATVSEDDARAQVEGALAELDERERLIVELRYGFADGRSHTLAEIGEELDLSRERVRQIEKEALAKLRHPASGRSLGTLLEAVAA